jgi:TolB-like protein
LASVSPPCCSSCRRRRDLAARDRSRPAAPVAEQAATAHPAKSVPDLSIVVLPFANLSNDPAQDYFADGITQNLTNDLSRIDGLFIISPNTAFAWKGKAVDARQIGKELGVRYVLKGSVQRDQSRVRVTAQLTDAATGGQVSGDTFEKPITRSGGPSRRSSSRRPRSISSLTAASDRGRRLWLTVFDRRPTPEAPRPNNPLAISPLMAWREPLPRQLESAPPRFGNPL